MPESDELPTTQVEPHVPGMPPGIRIALTGDNMLILGDTIVGKVINFSMSYRVLESHNEEWQGQSIIVIDRAERVELSPEQIEQVFRRGLSDLA